MEHRKKLLFFLYYTAIALNKAKGLPTSFDFYTFIVNFCL